MTDPNQIQKVGIAMFSVLYTTILNYLATRFLEIKLTIRISIHIADNNIYLPTNFMKKSCYKRYIASIGKNVSFDAVGLATISNKN